jgi:hypothetical protein
MFVVEIDFVPDKDPLGNLQAAQTMKKWPQAYCTGQESGQ